ncbi:hypothetical protein TX24_08910 [Pseudomonas lactis]|nr:hypothetical protein TX24_29435 [Pseudomonas lactis]KRP81324.1 hypothetical protein TX24_08910 [Pseudomonas lactis]
MPILAPGFRELNHKRITQLAKEGLSPQTIAGVIRDETQSDVKLNAADIPPSGRIVVTLQFSPDRR